MNDKKVTLRKVMADASYLMETPPHYHTVSPQIRLAGDYLYIEERCVSCGKILGGRRIKTEPLPEVDG